MKYLKEILINETIRLFRDYDKQNQILTNIDAKGNYIYAKLDEYLIRKGYSQSAVEDARTSDLIFYPEVYPNDLNIFVEKFIDNKNLNYNVQYNVNNLDDETENELELLFDDIIIFASNHPTLLDFKFYIEETFDQYKKLKNS